MGKSTIYTQELLKSLKKGEKSAFKLLFDQYEKRLYYFVLAITKSNYATEEIIQEVFIKIWVHRKNIDITRSFDAYIYTIARNHTYNYLRGVANKESLQKELWRNLKHYYEQTENRILLSEYEDIVNDILENLPVKKRSIFILSRQEGKSNQEIADLLNISPKTVKNHLWKTLKLIRMQLKPYLNDTIITLLLIASFY